MMDYLDIHNSKKRIEDNRKILDWTRKEIELIHKEIAESDYENSVKKDTLTTLKRV